MNENLVSKYCVINTHFFKYSPTRNSCVVTRQHKQTICVWMKNEQTRIGLAKNELSNNARQFFFFFKQVRMFFAFCYSWLFTLFHVYLIFFEDNLAETILPTDLPSNVTKTLMPCKHRNIAIFFLSLLEL